MRPPSMILDAWVLFARRHGLGPWAALLLESLEPLAPLGAQMLYLVQPLLGWKGSTVRSLSEFLESGEARAQLGRLLTDEERP